MANTEETVIRGRLRNVVDLENQMALVAIEVETPHTVTQETQKRIDQRLQSIPEQHRNTVKQVLNEDLASHTDYRLIEIPMPLERARQFSNLKGREIEFPLNITAAEAARAGGSRDNRTQHAGGTSGR